MKPGGPRKAGAADFASRDDRLELLDQVSAHVRDISHYNVMKRGLGALLL